MKAERISEILYDEWDPIGVKGVAPEDEYESYAERIISIIEQGGGRDEILESLDRSRTREMMSESDRQADARVTDSIEDYHQSASDVPSPG